MTSRKRMVAIAILAAAGLWPFVHRALVPVFDFNPWRLGGWAMYATPEPPVLAILFRPEKGGLTPLLDLPLPVEEALKRFRSNRHALGNRVLPNRVAQAAFDTDPELDGFVVLVQKMRLDHRTARMTSTKHDYWYERRAFFETHAPIRGQVHPPAVQ